MLAMLCPASNLTTVHGTACQVLLEGLSYQSNIRLCFHFCFADVSCRKEAGISSLRGSFPSLQLAKKYIDVTGVARINYERTMSPSRGANSNISAEMLSHRVVADSSFRSSVHHYPPSRTSNARPSVDETETANYFTSRIAIQRDGKRVPSSTQSLTIKAPSPSRGRQYTPLY